MTRTAHPLLGPALGSLCWLALACNVGPTRITGEGVPCSSSGQCQSGDVCFVGECRGSSTALASVLAEVRPPPGSGYGVLQVGPIDLRQSVLVNLTLEPQLSVAGEVSQLLGAQPSLGTSAVSGASVTFASRSHVIPDRLQQTTVSTSSGGAFSTPLPVGIWDAEVVPPAPLPPLDSPLGLSSSSPALQLTLPSSSALLRVQGQLSAGGVPLAGARVLAVDANGNILAAAASADLTGLFQLVLPPDAPSFDLRVGPASDATSAGGLAATLLPDYAPVGPFTASDLAISYDFGALPAASTLSGNVVDSAGNPVSGARVYALSLDGQGYVLSTSAQSGAGGIFSLPLLAGQFAIEAAPSSSASAPGLSAEQDLELAAPGQSITLVCPARVSAYGTILQANGKPAPQGTQISATRLPDRLVTGRVAQTQPTDASGNFTLVADAGTYRISIVPPASSGLASKVVEIDIEPATAALPVLQLSEPLQVVGTLLGANGAGATSPLEGATVEFFALDVSGEQSLSLGSGLTDSSGHYVAVLPDVQQPDDERP